MSTDREQSLPPGNKNTLKNYLKTGKWQTFPIKSMYSIDPTPNPPLDTALLDPKKMGFWRHTYSTY